MIYVYIASGCIIAATLFFAFGSVACCMLSSKISQAEEKLKNSKNQR